MGASADWALEASAAWAPRPSICSSPTTLVGGSSGPLVLLCPAVEPTLQRSRGLWGAPAWASPVGAAPLWCLTGPLGALPLGAGILAFLPQEGAKHGWAREWAPRGPVPWVPPPATGTPSPGESWVWIRRLLGTGLQGVPKGPQDCRRMGRGTAGQRELCRPRRVSQLRSGPTDPSNPGRCGADPLGLGAPRLGPGTQNPVQSSLPVAASFSSWVLSVPRAPPGASRGARGPLGGWGGATYGHLTVPSGFLFRVSLASEDPR